MHLTHQVCSKDSDKISQVLSTFNKSQNIDITETQKAATASASVYAIFKTFKIQESI